MSSTVLRPAALLLALLAASAVPTARAGDGRELLVKAGTVIPVSSPPLRDGAVLCRDGKIVAVGPAAEVQAAPGAEVVDLGPHGVLLPGLVAAATGLSDCGDGGPSSLEPSTRAVDGFDWYADRKDLLAGGITTVHLDAARGRVVGGQGAVVKLAGASAAARTLRETAGVFGAVGDAARNPPSLFDAPSVPDPVLHPLLPLRPQSPSTRMAAVGMLREALEGARTRALGAATPAPDPGLDALGAAATGRASLRLQAVDAADLRAAMDLAREFGGLRLVLQDARDIHLVLDPLDGKTMSVVLVPPVTPGRIDRGDDPADAGRRAAALRNAAALAARGIPFAVSAADRSLPELLLVAASTARAGLPREHALRSVTLDAARILDVQDRVGSLEPGKDADLAGFSGDPFDVRTTATVTVVDGVVVWRRRPSEGVLVLRAAAVHDGTGRVFTPGMVVVEDGKVVEAGPSVGVPPGARIVDEGDAVIVPGLIDGHSRLGLRSPGARPSAGDLTTAASVLDAVAPDDPSFAAALGAGITTALIAPGGGGSPSGTTAVVKTGGGSLEKRTLRAAAGVEFSLEGAEDLPGAMQGMRDLFKRAKDYHGRWEKYDKEMEAHGKAVKEYEAAVKAREKAEKKAAEEKARDAAPAADGAKDGDAAKKESDAKEKKDGKKDDKKEAEKPVPKKPKEPDRPGTDPGLEPFRDLLRKKATVFVRAASPPEVAGALKVVVEEEKLLLVIVQGDGAWRHGEALRKAGVGVLLGPRVVYDEDGRAVNAARELSRTNTVFALCSDAGSGSRDLPLLAAWAVRHGLGPAAAVRALTLDAARLLGVDDRVGSLEPGKDADLVVLSGDPFDAASRVRAVYIGGTVVGGE